MLMHKGTETIRTERLVLRRFRIEDAEAMFRNWAKDERVTRYLTWQAHPSADLTRKLLAGWCAQYEDQTTYNWVMEYEGDAIGNIGVVALSERNENAALGYCMGHEFWGKGLMTEAARAVIDFLFAQVGLHRVTICHAVDNPASGKVAQKCGMQYEGMERGSMKTGSGEFVDLRCYGILREDWEAARAQQK